LYFHGDQLGFDIVDYEAWNSIRPDPAPSSSCPYEFLPVESDIRDTSRWKRALKRNAVRAEAEANQRIDGIAASVLQEAYASFVRLQED
jgi:hypothetical protein